MLVFSAWQRRRRGIFRNIRSRVEGLESRTLLSSGLTGDARLQNLLQTYGYYAKVELGVVGDPKDARVAEMAQHATDYERVSALDERLRAIAAERDELESAWLASADDVS